MAKIMPPPLRAPETKPYLPRKAGEFSPEDEAIKIMVIGDYGTGKSAFGTTFPSPAFVLDFDKGVSLYRDTDFDYEQFDASSQGWILFEKVFRWLTKEVEKEKMTYFDLGILIREFEDYRNDEEITDKNKLLDFDDFTPISPNTQEPSTYDKGKLKINLLSTGISITLNKGSSKSKEKIPLSAQMKKWPLCSTAKNEPFFFNSE